MSGETFRWSKPCGLGTTNWSVQIKMGEEYLVIAVGKDEVTMRKLRGRDGYRRQTSGDMKDSQEKFQKIFSRLKVKGAFSRKKQG